MHKATATPAKKQKKRDPDMMGAEIAMKRAAEKARQKAQRVGRGIVIWKDGHVTELRQQNSAAKQVFREDG